MLRYWLVLALLLALTSPALAQLKDDDYVTKFIGTTAAFAFDKLPHFGDVVWGDSVPAELTTGGAIVLKIVNELRTKNKVQPLLDPAGFVSGWGQQGVGADGKYYLTLDFPGQRPSEVAAVLDYFGGAQQILPGATLSFWPLNKRDYYFSRFTPGEPISCLIGGTKLSIDPEQTLTAIRQQVLSALQAQFGPEIMLDVYYYQSLGADGGRRADLSVTAIIPTDIVPDLRDLADGPRNTGE